MRSSYKTVRDFLDIYLIRHKGYSLNTQKSYREAINLLLLYFKMERGLEYANVGFEDITYSNITGFLEWLSKSRGCSPATVNLRLMAIRSFTKYAGILDSGKIYMQVEVGNISIRKTPGTVVEFLTVPALETLFEQPNRFKTNGYRDFCFMRLMYDTAARCQELVDAKIHDLIIRKTHATICLAGKGNKLRIVPISHLWLNCSKLIWIKRIRPSRGRVMTIFSLQRIMVVKTECPPMLLIYL